MYTTILNIYSLLAIIIGFASVRFSTMGMCVILEINDRMHCNLPTYNSIHNIVRAQVTHPLCVYIHANLIIVFNFDFGDCIY